MSKQINIAVCGAQGYVGKAFIDLLPQHPYLHFAGILSREGDGEKFNKLAYFDNEEACVFSLLDLNEGLVEVDVLVLATPPQASMIVAASLKNKKIKIIDLSGAFRLNSHEFSQWYGFVHTASALLGQAHYGLLPWGKIQPNSIQIIANPGCYATCALMALIPLLKKHIIKSSNIIIDAKSGVSGAGKKTNNDLIFCEMAENFFPYKIGQHQHIPEINNALLKFTDKICNFNFVTHMLPISRGISMSIYADAQEWMASDVEILAAIHASYEELFSNYSLVRFGAINHGQLERDKYLLSLKSVVGTPKTHIGFYVDAGKVLIFACIDNLLKGAASQAIENINALYHWPLEMGLCSLEKKS